MKAKQPSDNHGASSARIGLSRPLRDFLLLMPRLAVNAESAIDYEAVDPALLVQLADSSETVMRTIHLGIAAIGLLLSHSASEIEIREISGDAVEALGWLMAELGEFAAVSHCIAVACRRYTAGYSPRTITIIPNAIP